MNVLYQSLLNQNINNVQIIAIGKGQYSSKNSNWTGDNSIPVVNDPSPNDTWTNWDASQRGLYFLDVNGNYVEDFNITIWDYNKIYNSIMNIISGCTDFEDANYDPDTTIDDGSCALAIETPMFPNQYSITSFYPNPFNPTTTISFSIPEFGLVTITAYDLTGRKLVTIININLNPGNYSIDWNASSFPSGVYLINMESSNFKKVQKVVLIK